MDNLQDVLSFHHNLYPAMEFEDIYKLIFQHCYGAKHLEMKKENILSYLKNESQNLKNGKVKIVGIGNNFYRVSLINDESFLADLAEAFYQTVNKFIVCFDIEKMFIKNKFFICRTFNIDESIFEEKLKTLKDSGFPAISHSEKYKKIYSPHYRVIHKDCLKLLKIIFKNQGK